MKNFEIMGIFLVKGKEHKFSKKLSALNEGLAAERIYTLMGSKHKLKRRNIQISEIKEVSE